MGLKINPLSHKLKKKWSKLKGLEKRKLSKLQRLAKRRSKHLEQAKKKAMKARIINRVKNKAILSMIAADICKSPKKLLRKVIRAILQGLI